MKDNTSHDTILTHVRVSIIAMITTLIIVSGIYPLVVWGLAQALFHDKANGSLIRNAKGEVVASRLIGQSFSGPKYFHSRPSQNNYDPTNTGGSNYGPMNKTFLYGSTTPATTQPVAPATQPTPESVAFDGVQLRVVLYAWENKIPYESSQPLKEFMDGPDSLSAVKLIDAFNDAAHPLTFKPAVAIPADAVTASGSGLDPHISSENAVLQAQRVAGARHMTIEAVKKLITQNTDGPDLGILGKEGVNVVTLNLALDNMAP
jgi:K+-transporting ATPase ATPase C chain